MEWWAQARPISSGQGLRVCRASSIVQPITCHLHRTAEYHMLCGVKEGLYYICKGTVNRPKILIVWLHQL